MHNNNLLKKKNENSRYFIYCKRSMKEFINARPQKICMPTKKKKNLKSRIKAFVFNLNLFDLNILVRMIL